MKIKWQQNIAQDFHIFTSSLQHWRYASSFQGPDHHQKTCATQKTCTIKGLLHHNPSGTNIIKPIIPITTLHFYATLYPWRTSQYFTITATIASLRHTK